MAQSYPDLPLTPNAWTDIPAVGGYSGVANQKVTIQNKSGYRAFVYIGGAAAPSAADSGIALNSGQSVTGTSDHFWVRGPGIVAVLVED